MRTAALAFHGPSAAAQDFLLDMLAEESTLQPSRLRDSFWACWLRKCSWRASVQSLAKRFLRCGLRRRPAVGCHVRCCKVGLSRELAFHRQQRGSQQILMYNPRSTSPSCLALCFVCGTSSACVLQITLTRFFPGALLPKLLTLNLMPGPEQM